MKAGKVPSLSTSTSLSISQTSPTAIPLSASNYWDSQLSNDSLGDKLAIAHQLYNPSLNGHRIIANTLLNLGPIHFTIKNPNFYCIQDM